MSDTTRPIPDVTPTLAYPPDAVLDTPQVARWLRISARQVQRLPIKRIALDSRNVRYLAGDVYDFLKSRGA